MEAVIRSGRAVSETAAAFAVSWWMVRTALNEAFLTLADVDQLSPRMLGIDSESKLWMRFEPWMTTIVDVDTGQVLGVVDGRDHTGVGEWLFARLLEWWRAVLVVANDPSSAFRRRRGWGFPGPPSLSIIST
ncbi:transposase [Arthrobacter sp. MMS24-S77]